MSGSVTLFDNSVSTDAAILRVRTGQTVVRLNQLGENAGNVLVHVNEFATQVNQYLIAPAAARSAPLAAAALVAPLEPTASAPFPAPAVPIVSPQVGAPFPVPVMEWNGSALSPVATGQSWYFRVIQEPQICCRSGWGRKTRGDLRHGDQQWMAANPDQPDCRGTVWPIGRVTVLLVG